MREAQCSTAEVVRAIAIDWSGAKHSAGKIWMASARDGRLDALEPCQTRAEAIDRLIDALHADPSSVAGLDFSFSYPAWFLESCGVSTAFDFWSVVARDGEDWLAACDPPFWGRRGTKMPLDVELFRRTEKQLRATRRLTPKSCFQIAGAGAVGTGSIRGIPHLAQLREAGVAIWPFDLPTLPLVGEIYPRLLTGPIVKSSAAQRAEHLAAHWPDLLRSHRASAIASDDAFDATVSALVMSQHLDEFQDLPRGEQISRLEGEVWTPRSM